MRKAPVLLVADRNQVLALEELVDFFEESEMPYQLAMDREKALELLPRAALLYLQDMMVDSEPGSVPPPLECFDAFNGVTYSKTDMYIATGIQVVKEARDRSIPAVVNVKSRKYCPAFKRLGAVTTEEMRDMYDTFERIRSIISEQ